MAESRIAAARAAIKIIIREKLMRNEGTVDVWGIVFSWSVIDGDEPVITVDHPVYGSKSERLNWPPELAARLMAKDLITAKDGQKKP